jgi:hypothetical protein
MLFTSLHSIKRIEGIRIKTQRKESWDFSVSQSMGENVRETAYQFGWASKFFIYQSILLKHCLVQYNLRWDLSILPNSNIFAYFIWYINKHLKKRT